ncbi:MAG: lipopolysaccharide heptosyltransferase II, partial [Proteobacteria bacterium]|nr:lipopolysaccharide heptosyltransferase II [Pseudomonadota bacterium]
EKPASGIIAGHPMIDELVVVKKDGWFKNPGVNFKTARRLSKKGYDVVIDFQGILKSAIWVKLIKSGRKIGFSNAREMSHLFLTEKLPAYDPEMHAVDRYMLLARYALGDARFDTVDFALSIDERAKGSIRDTLNGLGVGSDFVVLLPGARWKTKLWTTKGFASLAVMIKEKLSLDVVLAGSEADKHLTGEIIEYAGASAVDMAGHTTLNELTALLSLAGFIVTVDSGPMHIASAIGKPVIALFGATAPGRTGPYGKDNIIIESELDCSPCFKRECAEPNCMELVSAEQVMKAILNAPFVAKSGLEGKRLKAELS